MNNIFENFPRTQVRIILIDFNLMVTINTKLVQIFTNELIFHR